MDLFINFFAGSKEDTSLSSSSPSSSDEIDEKSLYIEWESADYEKKILNIEGDELDYDLPPFFAREPPPKKGCLLKLLYFVTLIFDSFWLCLMMPILRYFSRAASGLSGTKKINDHLAHGYFGWGAIIMLKPDEATDRFKDEMTNISIVAALMLTLTLPLLVDPPLSVCDDSPVSTDYDETLCNILNPLFLFIAGVSVWGPIVVASTAVMVLTSFNKCYVKNTESGNYLIKSLFNPYNGLTGFIGPGLYLGVMLCYAATIWMSFILVVSNYQEHPDQIWVIYLLIVLAMFGSYIIALSLSQMTELKIKRREMKKICAIKLEADIKWDELNTTKNAKFEKILRYRNMRADENEVTIKND